MSHLEVRRSVGGLVTMALLVLVLVTAAGAQAGWGSDARPARSAAPATTAVTTPRTPGTTKDLLDSSRPAVAEAPTPTSTQPTTSSASRVNDDNRRVWLVIVGLITVAVLLALLTLWFWQRTRPAHVAAANGPDDLAEPPDRDRAVSGVARAPGRRRTAAVVGPGPAAGERSTRGSFKGLDHEDVGEDWAPRNDRSGGLAELNGHRRPSRPGVTQRQAVLRRSSDRGD